MLKGISIKGQNSAKGQNPLLKSKTSLPRKTPLKGDTPLRFYASKHLVHFQQKFTNRILS